MLDSPWWWAGARATPAVRERWSAPRDQPRADRANSDAATLGRAHAIVRDRRHVTDRRDLETHRLERAERRFATRTGAFDFDFERADAVLDRKSTRLNSSH